jgi:hypothetical protein
VSNPLRRQGGIARRILDVAVTKVHLDRSPIVTVIGELVAAGIWRSIPKSEEPIRGLLGMTGLTMDEMWQLARPKRPDLDRRI